MSALAPDTTAASGCPYPGSSFFTDAACDSARFFGRDDERRSLITHIRTSRLTVLYAESGVGKSSLLRAGLTARLRELAVDDLDEVNEPMLVPILFSDWQNLPLVDLRAAVAEQGARFARPPVEQLELPDGRMIDVLRTACASLGSTLLLILDQFEEHLGRVRGNLGTSPFVAELTECLASPRLNVNVLIGVREDAFGKVDDLFRDRIAGAHTNMQLRFLQPEAAREAIELPVTSVYNAGRDPAEQVGLGDGLVDAVLRQVRHRKDPLGLSRGDRDDESPVGADDEIEAPFLQLVMRRLWEREVDVHGSKELTLETFEHELGGAKQIVRDYLDEQLKALSSDELEVATALFKELLTASGTKLALTAHDLAVETHHDEDSVTRILAGLDASRVVRSVDPAPDTQALRYEIFHDKFTEPILELLALRRQAEAETAQKQAETQAKQALLSRQRTRRWARLAWVCAVLCAVLAVVALEQGIAARHARKQANTAAAQAADASLSATAMADLARRPDISLLLLLAAHRSDSPIVDQRNIAALLQSTQGSGTTGILHGHTDAVESVAFDPARDVLASGGADKTIRLWHVTATHRTPLGSPLPTSGSVFGVAFSPDGRLLAAATFDQVELWSMATGRKVAAYTYTQGRRLTSIAFSPNDHLVAMGTADGAAVLWDTRTRVATRLAVSRTQQVRSVAFRRDGLLLAAASGPQVVFLRVSDHARIGALTAPHAVTAVAFSPVDTNHVAATSNSQVLLWTLPANPSAAAAPITEVGSSVLLYSVAFSPDGGSVAAGGGGVAEVLNAATGTTRAVLNGPHGALYGIAFSRDGSTLAAGCADRTVRLWGFPASLNAGVPLAPVPGQVSTVAVDRNGTTVAAAGVKGHTKGFLEFIERRAGSRVSVSTVVVPTQIKSVAFDPANDELAAGTGDGAVELWSVATHTLVKRLPAASGPASAVFSVAFNRDGTALASGGADGTVRIWPVGSTIGPGRILGRDFGAVYAVAFSPTGTILASGSSDHTIHLWSLAPGARSETIPLDDSVFGLAFSHDGAELAAAGADGTVRVWQSANGFYILKDVLLGHLSLVRSVAFSPEGTILVSGGSDGSIRLWDVAAGQEVGNPFTVGPQSVEGVAFSSDGRFFVSGGLARDVWQWSALSVPASFATLRHEVCAFLGGGLSRAGWDQYAPDISYEPTCPTVTP